MNADRKSILDAAADCVNLYRFGEGRKDTQSTLKTFYSNEK